jgi:hypothetical protein
MAWIINMCGSPAETGRKDLYIQFGHSWTYRTDDGESVRIDRLIHVREDGTVVNVFDDFVTFGPTNALLNYKADFDRKGNLYFKNAFNDTIYKYDPVTGKKETLLSSDGSFSYGGLLPSYDGSFLIVEELHQSEVGIEYPTTKLFPCDNSGQAFDIIAGDESYRDFSSFAVSRTKKEVYLSGHRNNDDRGLYKLSSVSGGITKDDWQLTTLIEDVSCAVFHLFVAPDNSVWGQGFKDDRFTFFRLIDRNEQPEESLYFVYIDTNSISFPKLSASHAYFVIGGGDNGEKILRFSYDNPDNVENLFDKIDFKGRDKNDIRLLGGSYFIAGGFLYFIGAEAGYDDDGFIDDDEIYVVKINLTTFEYTEITWDEQACTAIVGW